MKYKKGRGEVAKAGDTRETPKVKQLEIIEDLRNVQVWLCREGLYGAK